MLRPPIPPNCVFVNPTHQDKYSNLKNNHNQIHKQKQTWKNLRVVVFVTVRDNVIKRRGCESDGPWWRRGGWGMGMASRDKRVKGGINREREGSGWNRQKGRGVKQWNEGDMAWMGGVDEDMVR